MLGGNQRPADERDSSTKLGTRRYLCIVCGFIYDEALGDPDSGLAPGTLWEDVPATWKCPICRVGKSDFEFFPYR
jgi:rubredoxin-NAD+ reductase